jgi:hypothetical protein
MMEEEDEKEGKEKGEQHCVKPHAAAVVVV